MKKSLFLSLLSLLFIASCTPANPSASTPVESDSTSSAKPDSIAVKKLSVESVTVSSFEQYSHFDKSSLTVLETVFVDDKLTQKRECDDYKLFFEDGTELVDKMLLNESGTFNITVSKEGYISDRFDLIVDELKNFNQVLTINSYPEKRFYQTGETFTSKGLSIRLKTTYTSGGHNQNKSESITDYKMKIDGEDAADFVFTTSGIYHCDISYTGTITDLSVSFSIYVYDAREVDLTPKQDDSIYEYWEYEDGKQATINFSTKRVNKHDKNYYAPDEVEMISSISDLKERSYETWKYTPSTGNVPLLVIPVITPGDESKATMENWNIIEKTFFGDSKDLYFESLRSYYYKSSYGQLDFSGFITDYFDPSAYSDKYQTLEDYSDTGSLVNLALAWAKEVYRLDLTKFDSDHDGFVDGIDLVYLHDTNPSSNTWWAYSFSTFNTVANVSNPIANSYFWCGIQFLNGDMITSSGSELSNKDGDAHVLIHETGHMLGLMDYYSYANSDYSPLGFFDMMDQNSGDHNPYSKMQLGWIKPYVVLGDAEIFIPTYHYKDAVIVIPSDDREYKVVNGKLQFNVYDEYLVLDYYTRNNLYSQNYEGSSYNYTIPSRSGILLYHVDARLFYFPKGTTLSSLIDIGAKGILPEDPDSIFLENEISSTSLARVFSNTELTNSNFSEGSCGLSQYNAIDEIRLIRADKAIMNQRRFINNNAIFTAQTPFTFETYKDSFLDINRDGVKGMNNNQMLSTSFTLTSLR